MLRVALPLLLAVAACGDEAPVAEGAGGAAGGCTDHAIALEDGSCFEPGVPPEACPPGFLPSEGGCVPELPERPCGDGTLAVPGMTRCAELAPCGTDRWGSLPAEADTVFVDASYTAGNADGSMDRPFPSIQTAIDSAPRGAIVAIAAGDYHEAVAALAPVRVWGRCPELVTIHGGPDPMLASVEIVSQDVELRDLSITGNSFGVAMGAAAEVWIDRVRIHDTPNLGIAVLDNFGAATAHVSRTLVERAGQTGIVVSGATLELEGSEVRGTRAYLDNPLGAGVSVVATAASPATARIRSSYIHDTLGVGVVVTSSTAEIETTAISDAMPLATNGEDGLGIGVQTEQDRARAWLALRGVSIQRCYDAGLLLVDADATLDAVTVTDVWPQTSDGKNGAAVAVQGTGTTVPTSLALSRSLLVGARGYGLLAADAAVTIEAAIVRRGAIADPTLVGDGVIALRLSGPAEVKLWQSRVEGWPRAGVSSFGGDVELAASMLECNAIHLDGETWGGNSASFVDGGGNSCGCMGEEVQCKAAASNLQPPDAFGP